MCVCVCVCVRSARLHKGCGSHSLHMYVREWMAACVRIGGPMSLYTSYLYLCVCVCVCVFMGMCVDVRSVYCPEP